MMTGGTFATGGGAVFILRRPLGEIYNVVIPLTHHKNGGFTELKVVGVYHSPAAGGGMIWGAQLSFCL